MRLSSSSCDRQTRDARQMPLNPDTLLDWTFPAVRHAYTERDAVFYALSVGFGSDPLDERQLAYVLEGKQGTVAGLATVLATHGPWTSDPRTGVTRSKLVHGAQWLELHAPLPRAGTVESRARILGITDLGAERGAVIYMQRELTDCDSGLLLATLKTSSVCRADGGFGGSAEHVIKAHTIPERPADRVERMSTLAQQALIYRLNGDFNPLHSEPGFAARAGFGRPILHGLCTFGLANHALLRSVTGYVPDSLRSIDARFSAPVFPGEPLEVALWLDGDEVSFRVWASERGVKVLDNGRALIRPPGGP